MKLAYAVLADAAQVTPDGKVSMLGGDFDTIFARTFPAPHALLSLVMRFDVERRECGYEHRLQIMLLGPLNSPVMPAATTAFVPQINPALTDRPVKAFIVVNLQGLVFQTQGTYHFHISVDDVKKGELPLYLTRLPGLDTATHH